MLIFTSAPTWVLNKNSTFALIIGHSLTLPFSCLFSFILSLNFVVFLFFFLFCPPGWCLHRLAPTPCYFPPALFFCFTASLLFLILFHCFSAISLSVSYLLSYCPQSLLPFLCCNAPTFLFQIAFCWTPQDCDFSAMQLNWKQFLEVSISISIYMLGQKGKKILMMRRP